MYIPTAPPEPSARARELAEYLSQVVQAYQRDHPDLTAEDVRQALHLNLPSSATAVRALTLGLGAMAAAGLVAYLMVIRTPEGGSFPWLLVAVGGLVVILAAAAIMGRRV